MRTAIQAAWVVLIAAAALLVMWVAAFMGWSVGSVLLKAGVHLIPAGILSGLVTAMWVVMLGGLVGRLVRLAARVW